MAKDTARRDPAKESAWRRWVAEHAASGLSVRNFCRQHALKEVAFYWWRRELKRRDAERSDVIAADNPVVSSNAEKTPASFVPVHVVKDGVARSETLVRANDREACCIEIVTGGRLIRVRGLVDRQALTDVLEVLVSVSSAELERRAC